MEESMELELSGSSTTTSTMGEDTYDVVGYWNNNWYSPLVDCDDDDDYFRGLFEYSVIMSDGDQEAAKAMATAPLEEEDMIIMEDHDYWTAGGLFDAAEVAPEPEKAADQEEEEEEEDVKKGLRVVHLLVAAAEAVTGAQQQAASSATRDLARVILVRLKELVSPTGSTNMERLAAHFTDALQALLDVPAAPAPPPPHHHQQQLNEDAVAAFQLLQDMSPYVKFGHFTANQAILEAVAHDRRVHVVDYDIMEGVQWASLMQALASRQDAPHLRITALTRPASAGGRRKYTTTTTASSAQETGRRLAAFAASIGQPFSFHQCRLDPDENFRPAAVKQVKGEALVLNCMLHVPHSSHRSTDSVASFLSAGRGHHLGPLCRLVTLVEEDTPGPTHNAAGGFVARFVDSLHHYSALYDSLEAGFPMQGRARALVERVFLGPSIEASLARSFRSRPGEGSWADWMTRSGFGPVRISCFNHCQAKLLLGLFNDGYRVEEMGPNSLVLGWKSRRLLSASVWAPPSSPTTSSHSTTPSS